MKLLSAASACAIAAALLTPVRGAESLAPSLDPNCGLPRLLLRGATAGSAYAIRSSETLGDAASWQTVLQVAPGAQDLSWIDAGGSGHAHRFYRVDRLESADPAPVDNFALVDHAGVKHEIFREGGSKAVVLIFTDNAHLAAGWAALQPLKQKFGGSGVQFWLINPRDSRADLAKAVAAAGITAPVLHDRAQVVSRAYRAASALEAVAVSTSSWDTFYRGAVGDTCDFPGAPVEQAYLEQSLTQFLAGKPVLIQSAAARGESLNLPALPTPSYARDIAPILQAKCVTCHRTGDIGSWAMTSHEMVTNYTASIRDDVLTGRMPPWHADPVNGPFSNDQSLSTDEAAKLVAWVEAGAPRGTGADPLFLNPPPPATDWPLGKPDLVISIPTQSIPATGVVDYRYLLLSNPLRTNAWLRAAAVRPGNREVVHHALIFAGSLSDLTRLQGGLGGYFAGYVPGMFDTEFPAGTGKLLKAGSLLVFQMHYTTSGTAATDQTQLGLYFAKTVPAKELVTSAAYDINFTIPPGASDHEVVAESAPFAKASVVYEMSPHMHLRGKRMRFDAIYPDGSQETLLNVPGYEFAWQTLFRLAAPKHVPAGTKIRVTAGFDNSQWNPWNPDPSVPVTFGEQTFEEMMIGYLNYSAE
jgi:hypothetical protein